MPRRAFLIATILSVGMGAWITPPLAAPPTRQVLFVCEHGNVKSLLAASYFNELAKARGLPFQAIGRKH